MANRAEIIRLIAQLSNGGPTARTSAARFLGKQRDQSAVRPLTAALTDQERSVRHQAVVALGLLADPSVASHLESMLDAPNVNIRVSAIRSLADAGASSSIPKLALLQTTAKQAEIRTAASEAIRRLQPDPPSANRPAEIEDHAKPEDAQPASGTDLEVDLRTPTGRLGEFIKLDGTITNPGDEPVSNLVLALSGPAGTEVRSMRLPNRLDPKSTVECDAGIKPAHAGSVPLTWRLSFEDSKGDRRQQHGVEYVVVIDSKRSGQSPPPIHIDNLYQGPIVSGDLLESGAAKQDEGVIYQKGGSVPRPGDEQEFGFCQHCGKELPGMPTTPKFCPLCGGNLVE